MDIGAILEVLSKVDWVQVFTIAITVLFFASEALGNIPRVKENSVYQVAKKIIKALYSSLPSKKKKNVGEFEEKEIEKLDKK